MDNERWKSRESDVKLDKENYEKEKGIREVDYRKRGVIRGGITGEVMRNE